MDNFYYTLGKLIANLLMVGFGTIVLLAIGSIGHKVLGAVDDWLSKY